jgi:hypothetical protein
MPGLARALLALTAPKCPAVRNFGWDSHSYPEMGERAQEFINKLVVKSDILIAIFWSRLGSPTGAAASGTIEEIEKHMMSKKPTMIYFSAAAVPSDVDTKQLEEVRDSRRKFQSEGLVGGFKDSEDFRRVFTQDLQARMVDYLKLSPSLSNAETAAPASSGSAFSRLNTAIAREAIKLLQEAAKSGNREIRLINISGLRQISADGRDLVDPSDRKTEAKWNAALGELVEAKLVECVFTDSHAHTVGSSVYQVTHAGDGFLKELSKEAFTRFENDGEVFVNAEVTVESRAIGQNQGNTGIVSSEYRGRRLRTPASNGSFVICCLIPDSTAY